MPDYTPLPPEVLAGLRAFFIAFNAGYGDVMLVFVGYALVVAGALLPDRGRR